MKRPRLPVSLMTVGLMALCVTACDTGTDPEPDELAVDPGQIRIRVTGDVEDERVIDIDDPSDEAVAAHVEFLDRPTWSVSYLSGRSVQPRSGGTNTVLSLLVPGELTRGSHAVGAATPGHTSIGSAATLTSAVGQLLRETDQGTPSERLLFYPSTSGSVEITAARIEGTIEDPGGSVRGTARFSAREHEAEIAGTGGLRFVQTGRAVDIEIVFDVPAGIESMGSADLTLAAGPFPASHTLAGPASASVSPGPWLEIEILASDGEGTDVVLWLVRPGTTGTVAIGTDAVAALEVLSDPFYAEAEGGSVHVTELITPTATTPGLVRGTLDLVFRVLDGVHAGETFLATGTFTAPVTDDGP